MRASGLDSIQDRPVIIVLSSNAPAILAPLRLAPSSRVRRSVTPSSSASVRSAEMRLYRVRSSLSVLPGTR
jgi:hypothetical protein